MKNIEKTSDEKVKILDIEKTLIRLGNKQYDEAKRFIHSLKSVTGNIGAMKLSRFIVQFEEQYESYNEKSLGEKLEELSNLNEELLNTIKSVISIKDPEEKRLNSKFDIYEALSKLLNALEKARAKEIKDSMSYLVANAQDIYSAQINETKKLVYRYRYKDAKAMVEEIMDIVKKTNNG